MNVSAISSYNKYSKYKTGYINTTNFEGRILSTDKFEKIATKNNLFRVGLLTMVVAATLDLFNVEFADLMDIIPNAMLTSFAIIREKNIKLDEYIEFVKAETIEDARVFANEKLGIKNFKIDDLEYANWINEGLVNVSNKFKGNVYFPKTIKFYNSKKAKEQASYSLATDRMMINKTSIESFANLLNKFIKGYSYELLTQYNLGKGYEKYCELLKKAYEDIDSLTIFEKYSLVASIQSYNDAMIQLFNDDFRIPVYKNVNRYGNVYPDKFDIIYHEIGHCFDYKSNRLLKILLNRLKYKNNLKDMMLPWYPKTDISEFVACTFSGLMQGEKYQPDVMNLYNKLTKVEKV